jgi:cob(I)alamin adenosyltransferase
MADEGNEISTAEWRTGRVHVYTGDGKGKTSAALGLILRAAGAGLPVFLAQFIKGMHYSELTALRRFDDIVTCRQYGRGCFIDREPDPADMAAARRGLDEVRYAIHSKRYRLVVLDEANCAVMCHLLSAGDLLGIIDDRPEPVELVFTGRGAPDALIERADLVTEMREIRHYFSTGLLARQGIDK